MRKTWLLILFLTFTYSAFLSAGVVEAKKKNKDQKKPAPSSSCNCADWIGEGGYCVAYVRTKIKSLPKAPDGYAIRIPHNKEKKNVAVGDAAFFDVGPYGHVAYVEAVHSNTIDISEMNYGGPLTLEEFKKRWPDRKPAESELKRAKCCGVTNMYGRAGNRKNIPLSEVHHIWTPNSSSAQAQPPTPQPSPNSAQSNYNSKFIRDVSIPDGTQINAGQQFEKKWELQNSGNTVWKSSEVTIVALNDAAGKLAVQLPRLARNVEPGQAVTITVPMKAPANTGKHQGIYQLRSPLGNFGTKFTVDIVVPQSTQAQTRPQPPPQKQKHYIRISNIDDEGKCYVNGHKVASVGYYGDTGWVNISEKLRKGDNEIEFKVKNKKEGYTYSFEFKEDNDVKWKKQCGEVGRKGCNDKLPKDKELSKKFKYTL